MLVRDLVYAMVPGHVRQILAGSGIFAMALEVRIPELPFFRTRVHPTVREVPILVIIFVLVGPPDHIIAIAIAQVAC